MKKEIIKTAIFSLLLIAVIFGTSVDYGKICGGFQHRDGTFDESYFLRLVLCVESEEKGEVQPLSFIFEEDTRDTKTQIKDLNENVRKQTIILFLIAVKTAMILFFLSQIFENIKAFFPELKIKKILTLLHDSCSKASAIIMFLSFFAIMYASRIVFLWGVN